MNIDARMAMSSGVERRGEKTRRYSTKMADFVHAAAGPYHICMMLTYCGSLSVGLNSLHIRLTTYVKNGHDLGHCHIPFMSTTMLIYNSS